MDVGGNGKESERACFVRLPLRKTVKEHSTLHADVGLALRAGSPLSSGRHDRFCIYLIWVAPKDFQSCTVGYRSVDHCPSTDRARCDPTWHRNLDADGQWVYCNGTQTESPQKEKNALLKKCETMQKTIAATTSLTTTPRTSSGRQSMLSLLLACSRQVKLPI